MQQEGHHFGQRLSSGAASTMLFTARSVYLGSFTERTDSAADLWLVHGVGTGCSVKTFSSLRHQEGIRGAKE